LFDKKQESVGLMECMIDEKKITKKSKNNLSDKFVTMIFDNQNEDEKNCILPKKI
jgi:hypothetical protein